MQAVLCLYSFTPPPEADGQYGTPDTQLPNRIIRNLRDRRAESSTLAGSTGAKGKCGLWMLFQILQNWNRFSESERLEIRALLSPAASQKERVIGHFHIFYDTTGPSAPALLDANHNPIPGSAEAYVDSLGSIFNHVWSYETAVLGYTPPPVGSDNAYPVTILDLAPGLYGATFPDSIPIDAGPPPRYLTHIEVDNDYREGLYYSRGLAGLEVTAAHEFHHAIQIGSYGFWGLNELYFYEITSTWMEDVVYTDVNDYYQYLTSNTYQTSQFSHPEIRFTKSDQSIEYSRSVWGKFVEKRYSRAMMRRTWEYMKQYPSLGAIDHALAESGSSLREAYLEYALWNFNAGPTEDTVKFYSEGRNYPRMRLASTDDYIPPESLFRDSIQAISSAYHRICLLGSPADTCASGRDMFVTVSNVNIPSAHTEDLFPFTYGLSASQAGGSKHLANGLYSRLIVPDPENWSTDESAPVIVSDVQVFPNPYMLRDTRPLWFRFPVSPQQPDALLSVFNSALVSVFSAQLPVTEFRPGEPALKWDGRDDRGGTIATGVYFYVIEVAGAQYSGKFAAIRE